MTKRRQSRTKHRIAKAYYKTSYLYLVKVRLIHGTVTLDFPLLFDTGASHSGISRESFNFLGITEVSDTQLTIMGQGGDKLDYGIVDNIVLDGVIVAEQVRVNILPDKFFQDLRNVGYRNIGGILGGSFMSRVGFYIGGGIIDVFYEMKKIETQ